MRRIPLLVLAGCCHFFAFAQELPAIPDLEHPPKADSHYLKQLVTLSRQYYDINTDSGLLFSTAAIGLARQLKLPALESDALKYKGDNFDVRGEYDSAEYYFKEALKIQEERKDDKGIASLLMRIGTVYHNRSAYIEASNYFYQALAVGEKKSLVPVQAVARGNLALVQQHMGNYGEAIEHYGKVLELFRSMGDTANMISALNNMGAACTQPAYLHLDSAAHFARAARALAEKTNNFRQLSTATNTLAGVYYERKQYDSAIQTYQYTIALGQKINNPQGVAIARHHLSDMYRLAPDSILRRYGISPAARLDTALALEKLALQSLHEMGDVQRESEAWENMAIIHEAMKNYPAALQAHKHLKQYRDSIFNDEKKEALLKAKMNFEQEKKEAEHQAALHRQKTIRNSAIIGGAALLAIGGLLVWQRNRRRSAVQKQREAELRSAIAETELKALHSQMNPHFIFNCLGSIADFIRKNDLEAADRYLTKFAKLIRMVLENSSEPSIPLTEDLQALRLYMELEALRTGRAFAYDIHVAEDISQEDTLIPPMILQPFVENSIWHGVAGMKGTGKIDIHISEKAGRLECRIIDNGKGRNQPGSRDETGKSKSMGTSITRERLKHWQRPGSSPATLTIHDRPQGTEVVVEIPLYEAATA